MDFIEREKLRIEEEQKKKDAEKKAKEDLVKRKKIERQKKRDSIYKKVGPFMEKLLQKTKEKQRQAEAEKLPDPLDKLHYDGKFKGWKWEIDWVDKIPRLWGYFKSIEGCWIRDEDGKEYLENGKFDSEGESTRFTDYYNNGNDRNSEYWTIYIKCLVDVEKMTVGITAKAKNSSVTIYSDEDKQNQNHSESLQASYLGKKGLIIPITNDSSLIDRIADLLIEIRYTWKFNVNKQVWKKIRYKGINKSLKYLETSLQSYDNFMNEIEKKNPEEFEKKIGYWGAAFVWILFVIYKVNVKGFVDGIAIGILLGIFGCPIVFFIIYCLSHILAFSLGYMGYQEYLDYEKKCSLEISNKKEEISDLIKNLRATIDNDNSEEFVGDEIFLEFPLTDKLAASELYTKKDFTSKIERMIEKSKYEEKSN